MRRQAGVSLVEVMVGVTLAGLLIAMAIPSFQQGNQNRQIRTAAETIQNGLQLARTEALQRNRVIKFQLLEANGWRVGCDTPETNLIDGQQACPETLQERPSSEGSRTAEVARVTVDRTSGSVSGEFDELKFTPLGRVSTLAAANNNAVFRVTNPGGGTCVAAGGDMRCLSVIVTTGGQVRMCDPAVASPDPRAC